jgi:hypothetical protein
VSKHPKLKTVPEISKQPLAAIDPGIFYKSLPSWRVGKVELVDRYGWHSLDRGKLLDIREKLSWFETMTWGEILVRDKTRNHFVKVYRLCKDAQERLAIIGEPDLDQLVSLHLSGKERVWGKWDAGVLTLFWWDPNHEVCPSLLKHT